MDLGIDMATKSLKLCEHGTSYLEESSNEGTPRRNCSGTPFNGTYCSSCTCKYGECSTDPTTPNKNGRYGCKCPEGSKRFGYMCDKCNTIDSLNGTSYCNSTCKTNYFGEKCNTVCFSKLTYKNNNSICNSMRSDGGACHTCHGHGKCMQGKCKCEKGWFNDKHLECVKTCAKGTHNLVCSGHGECRLVTRNPSCKCHEGWSGEKCEIQCPGMQSTGLSCSGHGQCTVDHRAKNANCSCDKQYRGPECRLKCPGDKEPCDGLGVCDESGQCHCDAPALGACVASPDLIGDGECMHDRKSYKPGGCRSKTTKDSCVISKAYGQNCCQWKCFSNTTSSGKCVQVDQIHHVVCDLITDEVECSQWSMMKICKCKSESKPNNVSKSLKKVVEKEVKTTVDEEDDIEVVDPDEEETRNDIKSTALSVPENDAEEREPERIMEDCKVKGRNLPHNSPLRIGIIERTNGTCKDKFSIIDTVSAKVKYVAYFYKNCSVFDAFYEEKALEIKPTENMYFIKGFIRGLLGMCKDELRRITVPSKLGDGRRGAAYIPGYTTLVYAVEMVALSNVKKEGNN